MDYIFFTDLDGTILHSVKRAAEGDVPAEYKDGVLINLWTEYGAKSLPKIKNMVPVTTRSMEQYKRILFPMGASPRYAITANGGGLLCGGIPDKNWAEWAAGITNKCLSELMEKKTLLESDPYRDFEIRMVDGLFLFTKSVCPEKTLRRLGSGTLTQSFYTGRKIYVIPNALNKGAAAKLTERLNIECDRTHIICAGDSLMDIPLLNIADTAIFPEDLPSYKITAPEKLCCPREDFLNFVFSCLKNKGAF